VAAGWQQCLWPSHDLNSHQVSRIKIHALRFPFTLLLITGITLTAELIWFRQNKICEKGHRNLWLTKQKHQNCAGIGTGTSKEKSFFSDCWACYQAGFKNERKFGYSTSSFAVELPVPLCFRKSINNGTGTFLEFSDIVSSKNTSDLCPPVRVGTPGWRCAWQQRKQQPDQAF